MTDDMTEWIAIARPTSRPVRPANVVALPVAGEEAESVCVSVVVPCSATLQLQAAFSSIHIDCILLFCRCFCDLYSPLNHDASLLPPM